MQNCINSLFGQIGRKLKAEGAAGQWLCRASVLLRNQRRHHAAFGVALPPAPDCGSLVVLSGPPPATLRALSHASISSALSRTDNGPPCPASGSSPPDPPLPPGEGERRVSFF